MTTNETVIATANQSKKTFTLRTIDENGNVTAKYRTIQFSQNDFISEEMNTPNDWKHFLHNSDEYYTV